MPQEKREVTFVDQGGHSLIREVPQRPEVLLKSPSQILKDQPEVDDFERRERHLDMLRRFYLHKALEVLYPGFFAQLHRSFLDDQGLAHQVVENLYPYMSNEEFELRRLAFRDKQGRLSEAESRRLVELKKLHDDKVATDQKLQNRIASLETAGIKLDTENTLNFSFANDQAVYLDEVSGKLDIKLLREAASIWLAKQPFKLKRVLRYLDLLP